MIQTGEFLPISRLEIMGTSTHESKSKTHMTRILHDPKKKTVPLLCYINKFYSQNIETHNMKQKKKNALQPAR
jgi:hypothetical protein